MPNVKNEELEGITLSVYLYIAQKGKPVGPRETMKGAHLSSPSVAYRHLEKLEEMGYLKKNEYGEYVTKSKPYVNGFVWIGKWIMPKMTVYGIVFTSILAIELLVLAVHYSVENDVFKIFFLLLTLITGVAMAVFLAEGIQQRKRFTRIVTLE